MTLVPKTKPKPTIHHKKRTGQHHRQSKHYTKTYWPYLPLVVIAGLGVLVNIGWSAVGQYKVLGDTTNITTANLLSDTNSYRVKDNEAPLMMNSQLAAAAQAKANDMATRNYWAHVTPDGKQPWYFITKAGYQYQAAGENLAYGFSSSSATINGWMNSAEHRANILNNTYIDVGFGVAQSTNYQGKGEQTIIVAEYAEPTTLHITAYIAPNPNVKAASVNIGSEAQPVSRVLTLSSNASFVLLMVVVIASIAAALFILRHALFVRRAFVYSEEFVVRHKFLDIVIVTVATAGVILTRTAGFIR